MAIDRPSPPTPALDAVELRQIWEELRLADAQDAPLFNQQMAERASDEDEPKPPESTEEAKALALRLELEAEIANRSLDEGTWKNYLQDPANTPPSKGNT